MINSPAHAIDLVGGSKVVADRFGKKLTTVASWSTRQSIPIDWWEGLIDLARELGLAGFDHAALVRAHVSAKRAAAAGATTEAAPETTRAGASA